MVVPSSFKIFILSPTYDLKMTEATTFVKTETDYQLIQGQVKENDDEKYCEPT